MEREEVTRIYRDMFARERPDWLQENNPQQAFLDRYLPLQRDAFVLDAGCGNGDYARHLAAKGFGNVIGVDLFERVDTQGAFTYYPASIDSIPLDNSLFDFLYSFSVIFYLPDPRTALAEFHRLMKPGATLLLSAHTRYSLHTLDRVLRRRRGKAPHLEGVRFYSAKQYVRMLHDSGFELLEVDGFDLLYSPAMRAQRLERWLQGVAGRLLPASYAAPGWFKRLRSECGYHSLLAAAKVE